MSWTEVLLVLIIALLVFGPKQVASLAKQLGKLIAGLRLFYQHQRTELEQQIKLAELKDNIARAEAVETSKVTSQETKTAKNLEN